ncbi:MULTISPECIES: DegT/DnrJ/EryC1/StrS aminotransferase family protein [unclassified Streptomyces]|uniref:DegT/DnrJ/EryC1/StrS family aminotransferase n=1 Tax=unclassified Streptomyces TaxID=2593676 RepID=UPI00278BB165|nr:MULTISPECIES: DegT/DnrJ/EryC1/StrS family aminotransferase [unclassified Streptomyces]
MTATSAPKPPVPFFSGAASVRRDWPELEARIRRVAASGRFTSGPVTAELEAAIAERTGARHAIAVANGTDALIILLRAAGIGPGDEVIVPAYTFFATASAVLHVGADPVLVDVLPGSYAMDPARAEAAITGRTKAIMPVHLFSQMADMAMLKDVADRHGLLLLEDSAEGIDMRADGVHAGLWGSGGVLSFFPTKTLGSLGDAGMLLTNDDEIAATARRLRCHGQSADGAYGGDGAYVYEELGYNSRCDELQSAFLLHRLPRLSAEIERRAELAARYDRALAPLADHVRTPFMAPAKSPSNQVHYVYLIECDRRDELAAHLDAHGVGTEAYYPRALTDQPLLAPLPGAQHPVPVARAAAERALGLPMYPDLTDEQVDRVAGLIHAFYGNHAFHGNHAFYGAQK